MASEEGGGKKPMALGEFLTYMKNRYNVKDDSYDDLFFKMHESTPLSEDDLKRLSRLQEPPRVTRKLDAPPVFDPERIEEQRAAAAAARDAAEQKRIQEDLAARAALQTATTIASAPPHQGPVDIPRFPSAPVPQPRQGLLTRLANLFRREKS